MPSPPLHPLPLSRSLPSRVRGSVLTPAGIATFSGTVLGKKGTFAVQCNGKVKDGWSEAMNTIVEGTGTGELKGLRGSGGFKFKIPADGCPKDLPVEWEVDFA
jgi:hypothetical protein